MATKVQPVVPRLAYSPAEAAEALGVSRATINIHIADGTIPSVKLGGRRLIRRADLEALLTGEGAHGDAT